MESRGASISEVGEPEERGILEVARHTAAFHAETDVAVH